MEDVLTGRVLDHFHGVRDLRRGVLRHVDDRTFPEDPLRVLRGAQFAARFGFTAAPETAKPCFRRNAPLCFSRLCGTWGSCPTGSRRWRP